MNILYKSIFKNNMTLELKKFKKSNLFVNLSNISSKNFSSFSNSTTMFNMSNNKINAFSNKTIKNSNFYLTKKNNFAETLPKHIKLTMPNLSPTMTQGNIVSWKKKEGDLIKQGDVVAEIETDKAQVDFDVNEDGYLAKILFPAGSKDIKLGVPVAIIVENKKDLEAFKNYKGDAGTTPTPQVKSPTQQSNQQNTQQSNQQSTQQKPHKSYPKHIKMTMPNLSPTMIKGNIVDWKKKVGDPIKQGDVLASIETDKAQVDFDVNEEGFLAKILYPDGAKDINVGSLVAIIVDNKKDIDAFNDYQADSEAKVSKQPSKDTSEKTSDSAQNQKQNQTQTQEKKSTSVEHSDRIFASPLAKKSSREMEVDLKKVQGTGPKGRIIQADVLQAKSTPSVSSTPQEATSKVTSTSKVLSPEYEDLEISQIRKVIAERLAYSKSNIPHFYINIECNVDKVVTLRAELNKHSPVKLSFNDIIIKAASLACMKVPETNSSWQGDFIRKYKNVDMSVAVQTDTGLITPIITNSNLKGLVQISKEMKDLAERAKLRKLKPHEFQGGTFTISNMGMMGITTFSAVINPPQACILAVGKSEKKLVYDENAKDKNLPYKVANLMNCTLSCDHRVVDGAFGAMWTQEFKNLIENPELMLL